MTTNEANAAMNAWLRGEPPPTDTTSSTTNETPNAAMNDFLRGAPLPDPAPASPATTGPSDAVVDRWAEQRVADLAAETAEQNREPEAPGFDGGARRTAPAPVAPDDWLRGFLDPSGQKGWNRHPERTTS